MKNSQTQQILKALKRGRKITPLDALADFNCMRLGARIFDIKEMGYNVITTMVKSNSGKWFAQYKMGK